MVGNCKRYFNTIQNEVTNIDIEDREDEKNIKKEDNKKDE